MLDQTLFRFKGSKLPHNFTSWNKRKDCPTCKSSNHSSVEELLQGLIKAYFLECFRSPSSLTELYSKRTGLVGKMLPLADLESIQKITIF